MINKTSVNKRKGRTKNIISVSNEAIKDIVEVKKSKE